MWRIMLRIRTLWFLSPRRLVVILLRKNDRCFSYYLTGALIGPSHIIWLIKGISSLFFFPFHSALCFSFLLWPLPPSATFPLLCFFSIWYQSDSMKPFSKSTLNLSYSKNTSWHSTTKKAWCFKIPCCNGRTKTKTLSFQLICYSRGEKSQPISVMVAVGQFYWACAFLISPVITFWVAHFTK